MKKESTWTDASKKKMTEVAKMQLKALNSLKSLEQASYRLLFAGAAFVSFAAMAGMAIAGLIGASSKGGLIVEDFQRKWEALADAISERIISDWEWAIEGLLDLMDDLGENETFMMIISGVAIPITLALGVMGVTLLVTGIIGSFLAKLMGLLVFMGWTSEATISKVMIHLIFIRKNMKPHSSKKPKNIILLLVIN